MTRARKLVWSLAAVATAALAAIVLSAYLVGGSAADAVVADVQALPVNRVGLVLGCSPTLRSGRTNWFFRNRMQAAAEAFRAGKVEYLLVSGDNHSKEYDEPGAMRDALVALGVPYGRIVCDYAGLSTLDSVTRARKVFGLTRFTIITQRDHALRAVFIARRQGLEVVAYPAADVSAAAGLRTNLRESLARVRTVLDVTVLGRRPRFLGPRIEIGAVSNPAVAAPHGG